MMAVARVARLVALLGLAWTVFVLGAGFGLFALYLALRGPLPAAAAAAATAGIAIVVSLGVLLIGTAKPRSALVPALPASLKLMRGHPLEGAALALAAGLATVLLNESRPSSLNVNESTTKMTE